MRIDMIDAISFVIGDYLFEAASRPTTSRPILMSSPPANSSDPLWEVAKMTTIAALSAFAAHLWHASQYQMSIDQLQKKLEVISAEHNKNKQDLEIISAKRNDLQKRLEVISAKGNDSQQKLDANSAPKEQQITTIEKFIQEFLGGTTTSTSKSAQQNQETKKTRTLGINLVEKYKKIPSFSSLNGREGDFEQLKVAVGKAETPNAILVGPAGSGKTTLVEAWAHEIAHNNDPSYPFKDTVIISVSATDIISGATYVGMEEARVEKLIEYGRANPHVIYFFDELHSLMHNGTNSTNGIPNMLKKALSDGDIRIIGCTTNEEFKMIEKDSAFTRRFSLLEFEAPTAEMIQEIVRSKVQKHYAKHHQVSYDDEVISFAIELAESLPGNDPAKTLSLLDSAGSLAHLRGLQVVTPEILRQCINKGLKKPEGF